MYIRWKRRWRRRRQEWADYAEIVEGTWVAGRVQQRVVGYLGSLRAPYRDAPAHRQRFWAQVEQRLAALRLDLETQQRLTARLAQQVPLPTPAELTALAARRAELRQLSQVLQPSDSHPLCRQSRIDAELAAQGPTQGGANGTSGDPSASH